ncbi:MAG TPA: class I SAM-dependent methyltransferase [Kofleriaceae bacterium]
MDGGDTGSDTIDVDEDATRLNTRDPADKIRASYDIVAERYALELADEMVARPFERGMLLAFSELVRMVGPGVVGDVGCGPGHIGKHLASLGVATTGIDISVAMIEQAKSKFPEGDFRVASMFRLPVESGSWIGAVARYATLHCNTDERMQTFAELARCVQAGGYLTHSFYESAPDQPVGSVYHLKSWFGMKVDLYTYFVSIEDAASELDRAGFEVVAALVREPMFSNELPARRCTIVGKRR